MYNGYIIYIFNLINEKKIDDFFENSPCTNKDFKIFDFSMYHNSLNIQYT